MRKVSWLLILTLFISGLVWAGTWKQTDSTNRLYIIGHGDSGKTIHDNYTTSQTNVFNKLWRDNVINIKSDYEVTGDGTTDDATNFNAGILNAGDTLYIPKGTYRITAEITIDKANFTIIGEVGAEIKPEGGIKTFNISGANVTIKGLKITGDNSVNGYGVYSSSTGTKIENCIISEFDNCIWFAGADATAKNNQIGQSALISGAGSMYGVIVYDTTGALVEGNKITMPTYSSGTIYPVGIYVGNTETSIEENRIIGNHIYNGFDGITLRGPCSVVMGNQIKGSYEAGILSDGESASSTTTSRTVISNNTVQITTKWGIAVIKDNYGFSITGNNLFNCGTGALGDDAGIHLGSGNLNIVKRSTVSGNTVEGGKIGINIHNNTTYAQEHITISGNSVYNCTVSGIAITRSDNIGVIGNSVNNCTTYGIQMASAESIGIVIQSNILSDNGTEISVVAGATDIRIVENVGADETLTAAAPALQIWGYTEIDSSSNAVDGTLADGTYIGQIKTIVMTDETNSSTITIAHHETEDNEVATFDAIDETLVLIWTGTEWATLKETCTFL